MSEISGLPYCVLEYLYRDAGNWKTYGEVVLAGRLRCAQVREVAMILDADRLFVPEQLGLPPLQAVHAKTYGAGAGLDHAFHELLGFRPAVAADLIGSGPVGSVDDLIAMLRRANREWDCDLSPYA